MDKTIIMQLFGSPFGPTGADGEYLKSFDFEAHDGRGLITMTADPAEAMRFPGVAEAIAFRNRTPLCRPVREDGKPNRPLTATNWSFSAPPSNDNVREDRL